MRILYLMPMDLIIILKKEWVLKSQILHIDLLWLPSGRRVTNCPFSQGWGFQGCRTSSATTRNGPHKFRQLVNLLECPYTWILVLFCHLQGNLRTNHFLL